MASMGYSCSCLSVCDTTFQEHTGVVVIQHSSSSIRHDFHQNVISLFKGM